MAEFLLQGFQLKSAASGRELSVVSLNVPIFRFEAEQTVHAPLQTCWDFFSNPNNLSKITPPDLGFEVISKLPGTMYPGLMIEYRVRPLMNIPVSWLTEITRVDAPSYFVDEQRHGPYSIWHHEHFFTPTADGKVLMRDLVHYMLPFSPLGDWIHPWLVRPRLNTIFHFRRTAVEKLFPVTV